MNKSKFGVICAIALVLSACGGSEASTGGGSEASTGGGSEASTGGSDAPNGAALADTAVNPDFNFSNYQSTKSVRMADFPTDLTQLTDPDKTYISFWVGTDVDRRQLALTTVSAFLALESAGTGYPLNVSRASGAVNFEVYGSPIAGNAIKGVIAQ